MPERNFFKTLKERLSRKPRDGFDGAFWSRFSDEFTSTKKRLSPRRGFLPRWAFAVAAVVVVALYVGGMPQFNSRSELAEEKSVPFEKLIEQAPLIGEIDLFSENVDFSELDEEEWKILLEGNG